MAERPTEEQEKAIRERVAQASEGPWSWESHGDDESWSLGVVDPPQAGRVIQQYDEEKSIYLPLPLVVECIAESGFSARHADADFIANARQDVPLLLAEIDALRKEKAAMSQAIHGIGVAALNWNSATRVTDVLDAVEAAKRSTKGGDRG